jgi:hypothetical protein
LNKKAVLAELAGLAELDQSQGRHGQAAFQGGKHQVAPFPCRFAYLYEEFDENSL